MAKKENLAPIEMETTPLKTLIELKKEILEKTSVHYSALLECIQAVPVDQKVFGHVYHKLETAMLWFQHLVRSLTEKPTNDNPAPEESGNSENKNNV